MIQVYIFTSINISEKVINVLYRNDIYFVKSRLFQYYIYLYWFLDCWLGSLYIRYIIF